MKYFLGVIFFAVSLFKAQVSENANKDSIIVDTGKKDSLKIFKPTIQDYLLQQAYAPQKTIDTVFSSDKTFRFSQYNNQDSFGKIQFSNIGSGYHDLIFRINKEQNLAVLPSRKSHFILGINDISYFDVKTPTTSFIYHNSVGQGAALESTYTQNYGKNLNISVQYMGLRSQGLYRRELAANNHFIFSSQYRSSDKRYHLFTHYIHQNINNEENGGINDLNLFLGNDSRFNNRQNIPVNLENSESRFSYRRYFLSQEFQIINSEKIPFKVRHTLSHQANKYKYIQFGVEDFYASDLVSNFDTYAYKFSKNLSNTLTLVWDTPVLKLEVGARHQLINLGTDRELPSSVGVSIPLDHRENRMGLVGNLEMTVRKKFNLQSHLEYSNGPLFGNYLRSENQMSFSTFRDYFMTTHLNFQTTKPSFNFLINPSFYQNFNYNFLNAQNQNVLEIGAKIGAKWLKSHLFFNYYRIDQYAYFDALGMPRQSNTAVQISQLGGEATLRKGSWGLHLRGLFQNALQQKELVPMPSIIGRVNAFYQAKAFKNAAEIQTGIKVYYFSSFDSRVYFPVLNEFILSSSSSAIGGRPIADLYFNMKVKTMTVFAEAQHFNTLFTKNKSFAAPYFPINDFRINLGIVWHIFH